ncbi:MAG: cell division ATP-binding protein FtsE [Mogibacterium sp.]|nr:cell division ATP-binding protein FtsE [Mogibacterium sp.]
MIIFNNVTKKYGDNVGLIDASVHIKSGDFVFLVGPSGAGKTTFIRLILKEIDPDGGRIILAGKDITKIKRRQIPGIRQKIGMVFQDFRLLEKKTVYENVAFAMEVLHKSKKEIKERVPYVLDLVDIKDKANRYPAELSAGEQQRVGIARAIVNKPRVLICDEPTGNLDPITAMEIMGLLEQINVRGTTVLMVTHAKDIVDKMNKRVVAIDHGRIVRDEEGSYGFSQRGIIDDPYDPSVPSFATDESIKAKTLQLDAELLKAISGESISKAPSASEDLDSMIDAYLDGGDDIYE